MLTKYVCQDHLLSTDDSSECEYQRKLTRTMLNKNYGRASGNAGIEYAPRAFHESDSLVVPRIDDDEAYASRGWYRVINVRPSYDAAAKTCFITRWTVDENTKTITAEYTV